MKKVLLTGGSGFIGRNILESFLSEKYNFIAPTQQELDLIDAESVSKYISGHNIDIIINCASYGIYGAKIQDIVSINIVHNLDKVEKIIHLGSGSEYNRSRPIVKIKEEDFDQRIPKDNYGFYKYIDSKHIEKSDKIVCLRLFSIYGKYDANFKFIPDTITKNLLKQDIIINQNIVSDYLLVGDLMPILDHFISNNAKFKSYNITSDESIDLITITNIINEISEYKSKVTILKDGLNDEYTGDNSRLKNEILNLKFTDHKKGIEKLFAYFKENFNKINKNTTKL